LEYGRDFVNADTENETMLLEYDNLIIEVDSDDSEDLEWLAEFLCPSFMRLDIAASQAADCHVRLVRDPAAIERWQQRLQSAELFRTRAFLLDTGPVELATFSENDALIAYDDFFNVFFRWRPATGRCDVEIVDGYPENPEDAGFPRRARVPLMRAVREWAMHHGLRRGRIFLHAAAIVCNGSAVLLAGPKKSGKTSLLTATLRDRPDISYLTNDRVMVASLDHGWRCRGMPSIVSMRPGSMDFLPGIEARLRTVAAGHASRNTETKLPVAFADGRFGLSPLQFCSLVGAEPVAGAGLTAIVFPRISSTTASVEIRALSAPEAVDLLADAVFGRIDEGEPSALFDVAHSGTYPDFSARTAAAARLAKQVACIEVGLGVRAYQPEVIDSLLKQLFPPSRGSG
jgi:hypothetical protein